MMRDRPATDRVLDVAGWICAHLLFSGTRGIDHDGRDTDSFVRPAAFVSDHYDIDLVNVAVSSKLFRTFNASAVEPCHRTVAEFLGAKWLVGQFQASDKRISRRRVEKLFSPSHDIVPNALRGFHAWVAALDRSATNDYTQRDSYGCLRYGDVSQFSDEQVRFLLRALRTLAEDDPYFRSEDWGVRFGHGLARIALRDEILDLIQSNDTPYQLACVVLEALSGTDLGPQIADQLVEILCSDAKSPAERHAASNTLLETCPTLDWREIARRLRSNDTIGSCRICVELLQDRTTDFSGREIAEILCEFEQISGRDENRSYAGVGYRLRQLVTDEQLVELVGELAENLPCNRRNRDDYHEEVEGRLLDHLEDFIERRVEATAEQYWLWIRNVQGHSYHQTDWDKKAGPFFAANEELRRKIQSIALLEAEDAEDAWMAQFRVSEKCAGLWIRESDVIHHMQILVAGNDRPADWTERWRNLVQWARSHRDFDGSALELAEQHATAFPELREILTEITRPPRRDYEREEQRREAIYRRREQSRARARHASFTDVSDELASGHHLQALDQVASAYLNRFSDLRTEDTPLKRVSSMVGDENIENAMRGIESACNRDDIPTPRACASLRAEESKRYFLESICMTRCLLTVESGEELESLPQPVLLCALASCEWGIHFPNDPSEDMQQKLEEVVFSDPERKISFVRDTIEPSLETGANHVSGLHHVTTDERFKELVGALSLDWLSRFENASAHSVLELLKAAISHAPRAELQSLISDVLHSGVYASPEHRKAWIVAAFIVDFDRFEGEVSQFSQEDRTHLWSFRDFTEKKWGSNEDKIKLSPRQLGFLIATYAGTWPIAPLPRFGWGGTHPYNATEFLRYCISTLGNHGSDESLQVLLEIEYGSAFGEYTEHARHIISQARRNIAERSHQSYDVKKIRDVLCSSGPASIDDLQMIVVDELELLQRKISTGQTNGYEPYWDDDDPHIENYCRDRLLEGLEKALASYGVRTHKEGAMSSERRCDILCTYEQNDLPIEIKGQWHRELWNAACLQLEDNYSCAYRSEGRGLYLVLWFGYVTGKNPPSPPVGERPSQASELVNSLHENAPRPISSLTRLFVLDVSRPA